MQPLNVCCCVCRKCGGCTRSTTENKPYVLSVSTRRVIVILYTVTFAPFCSFCSLPQVMGSDGPSVVLATSTEEELAQWMAALCQAAVEVRGRLGKVEGGITPVPSQDLISLIIPFHGGQSRFHSMVVNSHTIPWWSTPIPFHGGQLAPVQTPTSPTLISCSSCAILLTQNKVSPRPF